MDESATNSGNSVRNNPGEQTRGTVLIVDDDVNDAAAARRMIEESSSKLLTRTLHSGQELISCLRGEREYSDRTEFPYPTFILLDLKMSGMDGFDVLCWLRHHAPHGYVPVIVLTGLGEVQMAVRAYALGARSFLNKPLQAQDLDNLVQKLQQWLKLVCAPFSASSR
jgi:CheY-like chemotaxis protein